MWICEYSWYSAHQNKKKMEKELKITSWRLEKSEKESRLELQMGSIYSSKKEKEKQNGKWSRWKGKGNGKEMKKLEKEIICKGLMISIVCFFIDFII